jgi:hypothetical protein
MWGLMWPEKLAPNWKRRLFWVIVVVLLVEVPLAIYIWIMLNRIAGK